jgi:quinol monooxygenase YgiN
VAPILGRSQQGRGGFRLSAFGPLASLLEPTRSEVGCIIYELMQNEADPADFTFYEEWTDAAALFVH